MFHHPCYQSGSKADNIEGNEHHGCPPAPCLGSGVQGAASGDHPERWGRLMGRPSIYTDELAATICEQIACGRSLSEICRDEGMPDRHSVRKWVSERADFRAQYAEARIWWAHSVAEDIDDLTNSAPLIAAEAEAAGRNGNAAVQALKVQIDSKRWLLSKIVPTIYGDRLTQEISGPNGRDLIPAEPMDNEKLALALMTILHSGPNGRNHPDALEAPPSVPTATTLLSASAEPEPATHLGAQPVFDPSSQQNLRPLFNTATGKLLRFVAANGGEQG
jgi:hypothetical protein